MTSSKLSVVPKQKDCTTVIADMNQQVVTTGTMASAGRAQGLDGVPALPGSLPAGAGGVPAMPAVYMAPQGRIVTP